MLVEYSEFVLKENMTTASTLLAIFRQSSSNAPDQYLISNQFFRFFLLSHTTAPKIAKIVLK